MAFSSFLLSEEKSDSVQAFHPPIQNREDTARLQDTLTGALIGLARATEGNDHLLDRTTDQLLLEGLSSTITGIPIQNDTLQALLDRVKAEKRRLIPKCFECASSCGRNDDFDIQLLWQEPEDIRSLKLVLLFHIRTLAAYTCHTASCCCTDKEINAFFYQALYAIGMKDWGMEELTSLLIQAGRLTAKIINCPHKGAHKWTE